MEPPAAVIELVERFSRLRKDYRSAEYNEARLRKEFLDPFFGTLGWDMENKQGHAEPYKDVIHEDSIRVGGGMRAPDYCFRIASTRKFFVEAKKPTVNIKDGAEGAYQLRRYAWTAKLPTSILTDFEEFAVYDCSIRPSVDDRPSVARTRYITFKDYLENWEWIDGTFSRRAVVQGAFDIYSKGVRGKKGTSEVDESFLEEIEGWREALARNLAERNLHLSSQDINFAVQRTIDRIIFLRICEDRGVEEYGQLKAVAAKPDVYKELVQRFRLADQRYNSGLFHFAVEQERSETPDTLTPGLQIDDKVLRGILSGLYYPSSPYEFSVLPADILGSVYERFLGKVVRLTPGHRAKIEEKPEVRKSGGVYYTPSCVVEYIVKRTLGELLKEHTPDTATKVRVMDPACGSGSFLLGAYQYLLDWHLEYYVSHDPQLLTRGRNPAIYLGSRGDYRLTAQKKKEILTNSIFGVDIDHQAIEVSKLSLLLKVLEGETEETINASLKLLHDRALPDLGRNLRHGNSLVGSDLRMTGQLQLLDEEDLTEFDWHQAFPKVFKDGGFDVVLGNPPYLSYAGRQSVDIPERLREYFARTYESGGWPTAHTLFLERAMKTISKRFVSFIVPDQIGHLAGYGELRAVAARFGVSEVRYWGEHVFKGVITPALTVVLDKDHAQEPTQVFSKDGSRSSGALQGSQTWAFSPSAQVLERLRENSFSLDTLVSDCGVRTTDAKAQVVPLGEAKGQFVPVLEGKRIQRYSCQAPVLAVRLDSKKTLHMPSEQRFLRAAFVIRQTAAFPIVAPRLHATYFRNSLHSLAEPSDGLHVNYLVGLLNSRLLRFFYMESVRESQQKAFPQVKLAALRNLPIRRIDLAVSGERAAHDRIVNLVSQALTNRARAQEEKNPIRAEALGKAFALLDHEIDVAVLKLYNVSDEDIAWIEERLAVLIPGDSAEPESWRPEVSDPVSAPKRARAKPASGAKRRRAAS